MKLRSGVSYASSSDGAVILDQKAGKYWKLNPSGVCILNCLLGGGTLNEAAAALASKYAVSCEEALRDVESIALTLESVGLLQK